MQHPSQRLAIFKTSPYENQSIWLIHIGVHQVFVCSGTLLKIPI